MLAAALAASFLVQLPALAADADSQEVAAYALTEAGLAKYTKATQNLAALPGGAASKCADDDDSEDRTNSISDMVARINSVPGAASAIQSAGMSAHEYVVFTMSLLQNGLAAWALQQPGGKLPPGVSKANVDFVSSHGPQLDALKGLDRGCGEDEADEEEPEE
jgi:hypothetical protein